MFITFLAFFLYSRYFPNNFSFALKFTPEEGNISIKITKKDHETDLKLRKYFVQKNKGEIWFNCVPQKRKQPSIGNPS